MEPTQSVDEQQERKATFKYLIYGIILVSTFALPWMIANNSVVFFWTIFDIPSQSGGGGLKALIALTLLIGIGLIVISRIPMSSQVRTFIVMGCAGLWILMSFGVDFRVGGKGQDQIGALGALQAVLLIGVVLLACGARLRTTRKASLFARLAIGAGLGFIVLAYLVPIDAFQIATSDSSGETRGEENSDPENRMKETQSKKRHSESTSNAGNKELDPNNRLTVYFKILDQVRGGGAATFIVFCAVVSMAFFGIAMGGAAGFSQGGVEKWMGVVSRCSILVVPAVLILGFIAYSLITQFKAIMLIMLWFGVYSYVMVDMLVAGLVEVIPDDAGFGAKFSGAFAASSSAAAAPQQVSQNQPVESKSAMQPDAPPPPSDGAKAPPPPKCESCQKSAQYVEQYQRYYCYACKTYV